MKFFIIDGKMVNRSDIILTEEFTDTRIRLTQKMWYGYGGIPLFSENLHVLRQQAEQLRIPLPKPYEDQRELFRLVKRMLNKNKFYRSGHILLQILAENDSTKSVITCTSFRGFTFPFSEEGLLVKFSTQRKQTSNSCNKFPFFNERLWQVSLAELKGTQYQQTIILNEHEYICECANAHIFMMAGNELIYPSIQSGCHEDAMLPVVINAAQRIGLQISERAFISQEGLLSADEIFIVSEEGGMNWILGVDNQRYIHYHSHNINEELNTLLKSKAAANILA